MRPRCQSVVGRRTSSTWCRSRLTGAPSRLCAAYSPFDISSRRAATRKAQARAAWSPAVGSGTRTRPRPAGSGRTPPTAVHRYRQVSSSKRRGPPAALYFRPVRVPPWDVGRTLHRRLGRRSAEASPMLAVKAEPSNVPGFLAGDLHDAKACFQNKFYLGPPAGAQVLTMRPGGARRGNLPASSSALSSPTPCKTKPGGIQRGRANRTARRAMVHRNSPSPASSRAGQAQATRRGA